MHNLHGAMTTEFPPFPNGSSFDAKFDGAIPDPKANTADLPATKGTEQEDAVIDAGLRSLDHCMTTQHSTTGPSIGTGSSLHLEP